MSILTIQPSTGDAYFHTSAKGSNFGSADNIWALDIGAPLIGNSVIKFDIVGLPETIPTQPIIVVEATLSLWKYTHSASTGLIYNCYRNTRLNWVESEVSWNNYKSGTPWTTPGGDFTTTDGVSKAAPANDNWHEWAVKVQVQYAIENTDSIVHFYLTTDAGQTAGWRSKEWGTASERPKLLINYTGGIQSYTWTSYSTNPTVINWDITPQFQTVVSSFGTGKRNRNSKWTNQRYKFRIKYRTPMRDSDILGIKDFFIARKGRFEIFDLFVGPLGATHRVAFDSDIQDFPYFMSTLAELGEVSFREIILE